MLLTYSELISIPTFAERLKYCQLTGSIGMETFGFDRYLNQALYHSPKWKSLRNRIIIRDNGCDLADPSFPINRRVLIHHLNPITEQDVLNESAVIFDPENLVCVSHNTHDLIHYGSENTMPVGEIERRPNDTCPWRQ